MDDFYLKTTFYVQGFAEFCKKQKTFKNDLSFVIITSKHITLNLASNSVDSAETGLFISCRQHNYASVMCVAWPLASSF